MQHTRPTLAPAGSHYEWGRVRIVHRQRARKLRKRGVFLQPTDKPGQYRWFESEESYQQRAMIRNLKDLGRRIGRLETAFFHYGWAGIEARVDAHIAQVQTFRGYALDAVTGLNPRPHGWTDAMVREYYLRGYTMQVNEPLPCLAELQAQAHARRSPRINLYIRS